MKVVEPYSNFTSQIRFRRVLMLLRLGGISVYMSEKNLFYSLYNAVALFCFTSMFFGVLMDVILSEDDFKHRMESVRVLCALVTVFWMHIYLRFRKEALNGLIRLTETFTWEELPARDDESGELTMAGLIPRIQKIFMFTSIIVQVYHFAHCTLRMRSHALVFNAWYPFNTSLSPQYEFVFISQIIGSSVLLGNLFGFICIYTVLVCVGCSQLEKFTYKMLHMKQNFDIMTPISYLGIKQEVGEINLLHHSQEMTCYMYKQLAGYIGHHQAILEYLQSLEEGFSFGLCGLFLILLLAICTIAFSAITSWGDHMDMLQALVSYLTLMGNLLVICWFGTQLTEKAEILRDAAFGCDWIGMPTSFQRCLIFIIQIANKEFALTAGGFAPVSNVTFMHMANQTMSFFMFLLHMMDTSEDKIQITH